MQQTSRRRLSVSVIIPAYNRVDFIEGAVDSCLTQTRVPDEIVVVDDGSTDGTEQVLRKYGPPVVVVRQPNRGVSAARNTGIARATGDILVFLDSDDLLLPRCIERTAQVLEERGDIDVVYPDIYIVDRDGNRLILFSEYSRERPPSGNIFAKLACRSVITLSSATIRRSAIQGSRFDESLHCAEDYDLWRQLAGRCRFYYLHEPLAHYRNHEAQVTVNSAEGMRVGTLEVQRRIMAMPQFKTLSRRERAKAYSTYGIRHAEGNASGAARKLFLKSIGSDPSYLSAYALLALSLLGNRTLLQVLNRRRHLLYGHVKDQIRAQIAERRKAKNAPAVDRDAQAITADIAVVADFSGTGTER